MNDENWIFHAFFASCITKKTGLQPFCSLKLDFTFVLGGTYDFFDILYVQALVFTSFTDRNGKFKFKIEHTVTKWIDFIDLPYNTSNVTQRRNK